MHAALSVTALGADVRVGAEEGPRLKPGPLSLSRLGDAYGNSVPGPASSVKSIAVRSTQALCLPVNAAFRGS